MIAPSFGNEVPELTRLAVQLRDQLDRQLHRDLNKLGPHCTLLLFDYVPADGYGGVAYASSLETTHKVIELFEARLARWANPNPSTGIVLKPGEWLPNLQEISKYLDWMRARVPSGVGYALIFGEGERSQYGSSGSREDVAELLRDMIGKLRGELS